MKCPFLVTCGALMRSLPAWGVRVEIDQRGYEMRGIESLPAWGVRVEIGLGLGGRPIRRCHSPHGECGLKYHAHDRAVLVGKSLPAWGVRVEIGGVRLHPRIQHESLPAWGVRVEIQATGLPSRDRRHSPHGECGLKSAALAWIIATWARHSPHGECGLKLHTLAEDAQHRGHSPHGECGLKYVDLR